MVHFNIKTQNLELVNLNRVTYAQPIPLALTTLFKQGYRPFIKGVWRMTK